MGGAIVFYIRETRHFVFKIKCSNSSLQSVTSHNERLDSPETNPEEQPPMSDLTAEQLEHFHQLLMDAKEAVEALLNQDAFGKPVEVSGATIGRLTRMDAIQVQAMSSMSRHQLDIRRRQIDASLQAMERGVYGLCRECKGMISLQRLEALPEAPFCLACQESFET